MRVLLVLNNLPCNPCSVTRCPANDDMRVSAVQSTGDVDIRLPGMSEGEPVVPGSNASTMSTVSSCTERDSNDSGDVAVDENAMKEYEMVRSVLYATRSNVNIVHEVFRQVIISVLYHHLLYRSR